MWTEFRILFVNFVVDFFKKRRENDREAKKNVRFFTKLS